MIKYLCILCLLFFLFDNCTPEVPGSFPSINESDLPDARFETPETYTENSFFGYINGGAELYLEYGFSGAWICEIHFMGGKYKVEIYRMNGPEEAFGIFSVSRFHCKSVPSLSPFTCQTPYQLQVCSGSFYINIINYSGNKTDSLGSWKIAEAIINKTDESTADISYYLPGIPAETINRKAVLAKGKLGIMNGAPDWEGYFGEAKEYRVVIFQDQEQTMLSVKFSNKDELNGFMSLHNFNPEMISAGSVKMPTGEMITGLSDNHLLITIKK